jgi:hypothetical protein
MANIRRVPFDHPNLRIAEYIFSWKDGRVRKVLPGEICSLGKSPNMISVVFKNLDEKRILSLLFPDGAMAAEIVEFALDEMPAISEILRFFADKTTRDTEIVLSNYSQARAFQNIGFIFTRETIVNYSKFKKMVARYVPETLTREQSNLPFQVKMLRARRM